MNQSFLQVINNSADILSSIFSTLPQAQNNNWSWWIDLKFFSTGSHDMWNEQIASTFTQKGESLTFMVDETNIYFVSYSFVILQRNSNQTCLPFSWAGVAVGCGWQAFVAYVNVGCYYVVGVPLGVLLGFTFDLGAKVEFWTWPCSWNFHYLQAVGQKFELNLWMQLISENLHIIIMKTWWMR